MRTTIITLLSTVLLAVGAPAAIAGGGGGGTVCQGFGEGASILMRDSCFEGTGHVVPVGETVTVTNGGNLPHTITAIDGSFDSGTLAPGETFELTLDAAGAVPVYCTLHGSVEGAGMAGLLVADDGAASTATPAAAEPGSGSEAWLWLLATVLAVAGGGLLVRRRAAARPDELVNADNR